MQYSDATHEGVPDLTRGSDKVCCIFRGANSSRMAGTREENYSTSRQVKTPGQAKEDLHEIRERTIFYLYNLDTLPFPPHRNHWREVLV
jgi:hypothetical protein